MEDMITATLVDGQVIAESCDLSRDLYDKTRFGEPSGKKRFVYALVEGLLLMEKGKFEIVEKRKPLTFDQFIKKATKIEPSFWTRYAVYKDLRKRGYPVKLNGKRQVLDCLVIYNEDLIAN